MSKSIIAAAIATVPALIAGSLVGGLVGGGAAVATASVADACGASDETTETAASVVGVATYYGVGGYVAYSIVKAAYDAFDE